jgi:hypothetical protein
MLRICRPNQAWLQCTSVLTEWNPEHNSYPWFVALEWESASRWELGGAFFRNSFHQPCGYLYGGKRWIYGSPEQHVFFKVTAGAIIGYFEPYENKLPVNDNGIGLGIIPAIGYKYRRVSTQFVVLGTSGFMITLGYWLRPLLTRTLTSTRRSSARPAVVLTSPTGFVEP